MKNLKLGVLLLPAFIGLNGALQADPCPAGHCSKVNDGVYKACKAEGRPTAYVVQADGSMCTCPCSCTGDGTSISGTSGEISVESLLAGALLETQAGPTPIVKKLSSPVENDKAFEFTLSNGKKLLVSTNHPFIVRGGIVKPADQIQAGDELLGREENSSIRVESIMPRRYTGTFHNVILDGKSATGADRVYLASGVQSGDWTIQSYRDLLNQNVALRKVISSANMDSQ